MIKLVKPLLPNINNIKHLLKHSFDISRLSNFGPLYNKAHNILVNKLGLDNSKDLVIVSSEFTALQCAIAIIKDTCSEITIPTYTFEANRCAIPNHIEINYLDVDNRTCGITPEIINNRVRINHKTDFIVTCPLSIIPDLEGIQAIIKSYNRQLIIDGASTFGTKGIYNYGDYYYISLHATKTLPVGEGGIIISSRENCNYIKQFINFGLNESRDVVMKGINGRVSEYTCAIIIDLLSRIDEAIEHRLINHYYYKGLLGDLLPISWIDDTIYQFQPIFLPNKEIRDKIVNKLNSNKIECLYYYKPLTNKTKENEVAYSLYERNLCLPIHQGLKKKDIEFISKIVLSEL